MAGDNWVPLWHQLPPKLQAKARAVARTVYRVLGNEVVVPADDGDDWWHDIKLSYIPAYNRRDPPQAIFLNMVEGEEDYPMRHARYMIDILRRRIKIPGGDPQYAPIPPDCIPTIEELEQWVNDIPRREAEEAARRRAEEKKRLARIQEAADNAARAYEERLRLASASSEEADASQESPEERAHPLGYCQVCGTKVTSCRKCSILSCPVEGCEGQGPDQLRACVHHKGTEYCVGCRDKAAADHQPQPMSTSPADGLLLVSCSNCQRFLCPTEFTWCRGKVRNSRNEKMVQEHASAVLVCKDCDHDDQPPEEAGEICTRSRMHSSLQRFCNRCQRSGEACRLHPDEEWYCSECKKEALPSCPTCKSKTCSRNFHEICHECRKIDSCEICRHRTSEKTSSKAPRKIIDFELVKCSGCNESDAFCPKCRKKVDTCEGCHDYCCDDCFVTGDCPKCGAVTCCPSCYANHKLGLYNDDDIDEERLFESCPKCGEPGVEVTEEDVRAMEADAEYMDDWDGADEDYYGY